MEGGVGGGAWDRAQRAVRHGQRNTSLEGDRTDRGPGHSSREPQHRGWQIDVGVETGLTLLVFRLPRPRRLKWPVSLRRAVWLCLRASRSLDRVPLLPREFSIGKKARR